jgi:hypothetical protein
MTTKKRQQKKQIPCGDDNRKSKSKDEGAALVGSLAGRRSRRRSR